MSVEIEEMEPIEPNDRDISSATVQDEVLRIVAAHGDHAAPRALLEAARDPANPLHSCFTWDDKDAGERYRLAQASALYRRVKLEIVRADPERREVVFETIRAVTSVPDDRRKHGSESYGRTSIVMDDDAKRASILRGIVREFTALRNKYAKFSELHDLWVVIDDAAEMFDPSSTSKRKRGNKDAPPPVA